MNQLTIFDTAHGFPTPSLPTAAWDLVSFLSNATTYAKIIGGGLVTLLGVALLIWGAVLITKKLFGSAQSQQGESWVKIVIIFILAGVFSAGGFVLLTTISSGGKDTIEDLGGGVIVLQSLLGLVR